MSEAQLRQTFFTMSLPDKGFVERALVDDGCTELALLESGRESAY